MTRYGAMFGPDITFLGVPPADLDEPASYAEADVVVIGAPFDSGTSHRPGTRFGPMAIRQTDYLPQDGSRPHLALRVDALNDIRVVDAGDVEMYSGDTERSIAALEASDSRPTRPCERTARRSSASIRNRSISENPLRSSLIGRCSAGRRTRGARPGIRRSARPRG